MIVTKNILRLVKVRSFPPVVLDDVATLTTVFMKIVQELHDGMFLIADLRPCGIVSREVAQSITDLQRRENPTLIRAAYLISNEQGGLGLQLARMLRSANHPARRAFDNELEAYTWLSERMTGDEQLALASFLKEGSALPVRAMGRA